MPPSRRRILRHWLFLGSLGSQGARRGQTKRHRQRTTGRRPRSSSGSNRSCFRRRNVTPSIRSSPVAPRTSRRKSSEQRLRRASTYLRSERGPRRSGGCNEASQRGPTASWKRISAELTPTIASASSRVTTSSPTSAANPLRHPIPVDRTRLVSRSARLLKPLTDRGVQRGIGPKSVKDKRGVRISYAASPSASSSSMSRSSRLAGISTQNVSAPRIITQKNASPAIRPISP